MTQVLTMIKLVLSLLPVVIQTIQGIEQVLPATGQGAVKRDLVKSALQSTYNAVDSSMPIFEDLWNKLSPVVDGIVTIFNTAGIFKKG
jgi:hypothetical protein